MNSRYTHLVIVLPCHSMEDFPTHHRGADADQLLAYWTALWHPALLHTASRLPQLHPADFIEPSWSRRDSHTPVDASHPASDPHHKDQSDGPDSTEPPGDGSTDAEEFALVVIPSIAQSRVDSELLMEIDQAGIFLEQPTDRASLVQAALAKCPVAAEWAARIEPDLSEDFHALGYAYLQVQMMTRQLRYTSNLDEQDFEQRVLAAAAAAATSDAAEARERLTACYDSLLEEKNAFYPVEPQLCDVTLLASTTLGQDLADQLERADHPLNLLVTGEDVERMASDHPENIDRIGNRIADTTLTLLGGLQQELPDWLISTESIVDQLQQGVATMRRHWSTAPRVFLRRRFGLHPGLPNVLNQLGYLGAIHATLDQGTFPRTGNGVIRWTGDDNESILSLADVPLDASDGGSFLGLGVKLGEMIDSAHLASALLVHWPGRTCQSFEDLRRITRYTPLLGDFVGLDSYFESLYDPGYGEQFAADEYRSPHFKQAIDQGQVDPISRFTRYWQAHFRQVALENLIAQASCRHAEAGDAAALETLDAQVVQLRRTLSRDLHQPQCNVDWESGLCELQRLTDAVADWLETGRLGLDSAPAKASDRPAEVALPATIYNATSWKRRVAFSTSAASSGALKNEPPIWLAEQQPDQGWWVLDVPGCGATTISADGLGPATRFQRDPAVVEEEQLQNEFFATRIDSTTGGIRSVQYHASRVNLFSQRLAVRIPSTPDPKSSRRRQPARYSEMVCDSLQPLPQGSLAGGIETKGRLVDGQQELARFRQQVRITRGIPRLEFRVELESDVEFQATPHHYLCSRLAWKEESTSIVANAIDSRQPVTSEWFHASQYVTVGDEHRFSLLTGGLPFHRRSNRRMLDSVLICRGESNRVFEFAIDIDQNWALAANADRLTPLTWRPGSVASPPPADWALHFNCRNVIVTSCRSQIDDDGCLVLKIRLRETEGRAADLKVRSPRPIQSAEHTRFNGELIESISVTRDAISHFDMALPAFSYRQISIRFQA